MNELSFLADARRAFHASLFGNVLYINEKGVLSNADKASKGSVRIAEGIAKRMIGEAELRDHLVAQKSGKAFEECCSDFIVTSFAKLRHLRPGTWQMGRFVESRRPDIADFEQYAHLHKLYEIARRDPELAAVLQTDYLITPDVVIARVPEPDEEINTKDTQIVDGDVARRASLRKVNNPLAILHASISCKWTLRSDRAQNARTEGLNLVRNRKGHLPHVVLVTGEPTPNRIASVAMGTGEIDCVYHFALPELIATVKDLRLEDAEELVMTMVDGKRLKDVADLPLDLAI
ncbi:MAG TPA: NgoMIV family type II restriction endonuclease [Thermoanaerobaculia bacterium]|nr:NgoMIV family type II restriction endonuclease [Thermoanaerobaculia bacterium]